MFLTSENKVENNFPYTQFQAYKFFRKDRNKFGNGIILLAKNSFPRKKNNNHKVTAGFEVICLEFSICNKKWLLPGSDSFRDCGAQGRKHLRSPCLKCFINQNHCSNCFSSKF